MSRSICLLRRRDLNSRQKFLNIARLLLGGSKHLIYSSGKTTPGFGLFSQLLSSGPGKLVVLRLPVIIRTAPFRFDPALLLEPIERGIERTLVYIEYAVRDLIYPLQNDSFMNRFMRECF